MVWGDLPYDDETTHPFGRPRRPDRVMPDTALFRVYRDLISMRKQHLRLFVDGTLHWLLTDDANGLLAYERVLGEQRAIVAFNASAAPHTLSVAATGNYRLVYPTSGGVTAANTALSVELPPRAARVWIRE